jgi:hypothetical protein
MGCVTKALSTNKVCDERQVYTKLVENRVCDIRSVYTMLVGKRSA